jgi:hypothetical protein
MKSFNELPIEELTRIYNSVPSARPVHLFRNKATAQERVLKHMTKAEALRRLGEEPAPPATSAQALLRTPPSHRRGPAVRDIASLRASSNGDAICMSLRNPPSISRIRTRRAILLLKLPFRL